MGPTTRRRTGALIATAALLASLTVATVSAPAAAQPPSCDGRPATITDNDGNDADPTIGIIVGTNGPDVIVGTGLDDIISGLGGRDIICGDSGDDIIDGGGGNDRLFGGSGDDTILGRSGHDDLFGFAGDDTIRGGPGRDLVKGGGGKDTIRGNRGNDILKGNGGPDLILGNGGDDSLNGGAGTDECRQGPGSGPVRNCETADLRVIATCVPSSVDAVSNYVCTATVKNPVGPSASSYRLKVDEDDVRPARCFFTAPGIESAWIQHPALGVGKKRKHVFDMGCEDGPGSNTFTATVDTDGRDPKPGNNSRKFLVTVGE